MNANLDYDKIYEIRLRVGRPLFYTYDGGEGFLTDHDGKYVVTREDLKETMEYISGYSLYSYEEAAPVFPEFSVWLSVPCFYTAQDLFRKKGSE